MDMVGFSTFKQLNGKALAFCNIQYQLFQIEFHFRCQYFSSVLDRPYNMVVDVTNSGTVMDKIIFHTYSLS